MKIINKHSYVGYYVDKHFFVLKNGSIVPVSRDDYYKHQIGDNYKLKKEKI